MTSLSVQFHADPLEMIQSLVPRWLAGVECYIALESGFPETRRTFLRVGELPSVDSIGSVPDALFIRLQPFTSVGARNVEFLGANPGFLVIRPGKLDAEGLHETMMGAVTADAAALRAWRRVITRAKRDFQRGAIAINYRGDRFHQPSHPYTPGALALADTGVPILSLTGSVRYLLGETLGK